MEVNNSVASSTSDIISFRAQGENGRNRERVTERARKKGEYNGRDARWRIIRVRGSLSRLLPRVSSLVIDVSPSPRFAAILMSTMTVSEYVDEAKLKTVHSKVPRECIIYECIKRNSIRSGIKSVAFLRFSLTSFSLVLFILMHFKTSLSS